MKNAIWSFVLCVIAALIVGCVLIYFLFTLIVNPGLNNTITSLQEYKDLHPVTITNTEYLPITSSPNLIEDLQISGLNLPIATSADLQRDKIVSKTVFVSQIPEETIHINGTVGGSYEVIGKDFIKCLIVGPAIFAFHDDTFFNSNEIGIEYGAPLDSYLLLAQGPQMFGVTAFRNCGFVGCRFLDIGFAGSKEFLEYLKTNITDNASNAP